MTMETYKQIERLEVYNTSLVKFILENDLQYANSCKKQRLVYLDTLACPICVARYGCVRFNYKKILR